MTMAEVAEKENEPQGPIINEVMCFIINKWGNIDIDVLTRLCLSTYDDKEIEAAKDLLFSFLHDKNDKTVFKKRRNGRKTDSKREKDLEDIFKKLEEKGDANIPDFVALDLGKLPPITFDSIDVSVLLRKIDNLECSVNLLKDGMNNVANSCTGMSDISKTLDNRVSVLELSNKSNKSIKDPALDNLVEKLTKLSVNDCERVIDDIAEEMPFVCTKCDFRFKTEIELKEHNESQHISLEVSDLFCSVCDYKCNTQGELINHTGGHKPFVCSICDVSWSSKEECQAHMTSHSVEKSFECNECAFKGDDELMLKRHQNVHKNETPNTASLDMFPPLGGNDSGQLEQKPYVCPVCNHRFASQTHCKEHMLTHRQAQGEKLNACYVCDRKYATLGELKTHIITHSDEKPFQCTECDYACNDNITLQSHLTMHKGKSSSVNEGTTLSMEDMAKQHFIETLFNKDGWSMPIFNGKPLKPKDMMKPNPVQQRPGPSNNNRSPAIIGTGKGTNLAIQNKKYHASLFATRYEPSIKSTTVKKELETELFKLTGIKHIVTVEKLATKYDHYASFKISCSCDNTAVLLNPNLWPSGILVRWWRSMRNGNNANQNKTNSNRS